MMDQHHYRRLCGMVRNTKTIEILLWHEQIIVYISIEFFLGMFEVVEILLENGANIHSKNNAGQEALDIAIERGIINVFGCNYGLGAIQTISERNVCDNNWVPTKTCPSTAYKDFVRTQFLRKRSEII